MGGAEAQADNREGEILMSDYVETLRHYGILAAVEELADAAAAISGELVDAIRASALDPWRATRLHRALTLLGALQQGLAPVLAEATSELEAQERAASEPGRLREMITRPMVEVSRYADSVAHAEDAASTARLTAAIAARSSELDREAEAADRADGR
jgi:hypothetical protein